MNKKIFQQENSYATFVIRGERGKKRKGNVVLLTVMTVAHGDKTYIILKYILHVKLRWFNSGCLLDDTKNISNICLEENFDNEFDISKSIWRFL